MFVGEVNLLVYINSSDIQLIYSVTLAISVWKRQQQQQQQQCINKNEKQTKKTQMRS